MTRHVLTIDLRDEAVAIDAYKAHHRRVWAEAVRGLQGRVRRRRSAARRADH